MGEEGKLFKNKRNIYLVLGLVVLIIITIIITLKGKKNNYLENGYPLDIAAGEQVLVAEIRLEIAKAALDSSGEIKETQCEELKDIVYKYNPEADWFEYCNGTFYIDMPDTDHTAKIQLSDEDRCAVLTLDSELARLTHYEFKDEPCKGYRIFIKGE